MTQVFIGVGSNQRRRYHIQRGIELLQQALGPLRCSPVYECAAVGVAGAAFYNLVVAVETQQSLSEVVTLCKQIEVQCQRRRPAGVPLCLTLDLDVLLYGKLGCQQPLVLPRPDICQHAFILRPLAEVAGDFRHPKWAASFRQLWLASAPSQPGLRPVAWQPELISKECHG